MGYYVNPSANSFAYVLGSGMYVDKSELIAYMNSVLKTSNMLVTSTRPRRFGKSFAAKMLAAYYSKGADSKALFENLKIAGMDGWKQHLNKYGVIFIDVASFISFADDIRDTLDDIQSEVISELSEAYPGCVRGNTKSLMKALMYVTAKTGDKFFIVIDEWDALFREARNDEKLQESYIKFLRGMFKSPQTSEIFVGAYMTGILPIKKYGTQSALTDFREYTMLEPGPMAPFIGFTEDEVKELCRTNHLDFEEARRWYDGYQFATIDEEGTAEDGKTQSIIVQHVYCPNSIMELVTRKISGNYWTKTETYESLRDYIDLNYDGLRDALVDMLGGKRCRIDPQTFQNDMTSIKGRDDVFTLLVHLGYLAYHFDQNEVFIPNEEVRGEFVRAVKEGRRPELAKAVKVADELLAATLARDERRVAELIEAAHFAGTAPQNYNEEQALRHVVITAYLTSVDHYLRFEELASGRGYCDILFLPRIGSQKPALLIELKWDRSAEKAISQIMEKQYSEILKKFDYKGGLLLIGVNYSTKTGRHSCKIE